MDGVTIYIVVSARGDTCLAFADQDQAERYAELSASRLFECDVRSEVEGQALLNEYTEGA